MENILQNLSIIALPILLAITLHEAAHAITAKWRGDDTAYKLGRVSLNPLKHVDLFGTIVMPVLLYLASSGSFLFGYAKPVPVNVQKLFVPRRDMILVALAGPLTNLLMAVLSALLLNLTHILPEYAQNWAEPMLLFSVFFNVLIGLFNLLPILPLDGGRVLWGMFPPAWGRIFAQSEKWSFLAILAIIILLPMVGQQFGQDWNIIRTIIGGPTEKIAEKIIQIAVF